MKFDQKPSVVVIGGGTGAYTILRGLKRYSDFIDITAIISMADSGGSTGRLRDEFGQLPVGDVRMALSALARDYDEHEELLRELFLYRFEKGNGLQGHNFGNLMLTALTDILGSEAQAVSAASRILRIYGRVLPVTAQNVHLVATYDDGLVVTGEHQIDDPDKDRSGKRIFNLNTNTPGVISGEAREAILSADLVILGPGDLYSSILANFVIEGVATALYDSKAPVVYVANLMERFGQTEGMSISDCVAEIERYTLVAPQYVLINDAPLPAEALALYETSEGVGPVFDDADTLPAKIIRADLLANEKFIQSQTDKVKRSLIRHDSDRLAQAVINLLE
jgi:uncharacterized cofD-like protein